MSNFLQIAGRMRDRSVSEGITGKSEALLQFGPLSRDPVMLG
jgi:hypothetical protein